MKSKSWFRTDLKTLKWNQNWNQVEIKSKSASKQLLWTTLIIDQKITFLNWKFFEFRMFPATVHKCVAFSCPGPSYQQTNPLQLVQMYKFVCNNWIFCSELHTRQNLIMLGLPQVATYRRLLPGVWNKTQMWRNSRLTSFIKLTLRSPSPDQRLSWMKGLTSQPFADDLGMG